MASSRHSDVLPLSFNDSSEDIATDEITLMKKELQSLIQEKAMLKAKVDRLSNISKHPGERYANVKNPGLIASELQRTESYIAKRREEIESLRNSDIANIVREQQREALILYQETKRQQELKFQKESEFHELSRKYDQMVRKYSQNVLDRTNSHIKVLETELEVQNRRVARAKERLRKRKEEIGASMRLSDLRNRSALHETIRSLKNRIKQEEAEISIICSEITRRTNSEE